MIIIIIIIIIIYLIKKINIINLYSTQIISPIYKKMVYNVRLGEKKNVKKVRISVTNGERIFSFFSVINNAAVSA